MCLYKWSAKYLNNVAIETRGFYKEERNFIYSVDDLEIFSKKAVRIVQIISQYYKVIV